MRSRVRTGSIGRSPERGELADGPFAGLGPIERAQLAQEEDDGNADDHGQAERLGGEDELGDERRTGLRARVRPLDTDEAAQRPVEEPHQGRSHDRRGRRETD